jgi:FKBP-type peptidyl-prolyl cis-trans isomerase 2
MAAAKAGDSIRVHYTGTLEDGAVFDSSVERDPLEFTIGENQVIAGFEQAAIGMETGDSKIVKIVSEEAYGAHNPDMIATIERERLPENMEPQIGQQVQMRQAEGQLVMVTVTGVSEKDVTLDANHPLAGKNLSFDIELVEIL